MINKLYSIHDDDADEFGPLLPAKNDRIAIRAFRRELQGVPDDVKLSFSLYCLGEMDTESGQLSLPFEQYEVDLSKEVLEDVNN